MIAMDYSNSNTMRYLLCRLNLKAAPSYKSSSLDRIHPLNVWSTSKWCRTQLLFILSQVQSIFFTLVICCYQQMLERSQAYHSNTCKQWYHKLAVSKMSMDRSPRPRLRWTACCSIKLNLKTKIYSFWVNTSLCLRTKATLSKRTSLKFSTEWELHFSYSFLLESYFCKYSGERMLTRKIELQMRQTWDLWNEPWCKKGQEVRVWIWSN